MEEDAFTISPPAEFAQDIVTKMKDAPADQLVGAKPASEEAQAVAKAIKDAPPGRVISSNAPDARVRETAKQMWARPKSE